MLCFRKFLCRKSLWSREERYQDFPLKNFCFTMPKSFAREPFSVVFQKTFGSEKKMDKRGVSRFSVCNFLS